MYAKACGRFEFFLLIENYVHHIAKYTYAGIPNVTLHSQVLTILVHIKR